MLSLTIDSSEVFDEKTQTFIEVKGQTIQLEHSLLSISKWEAKHHAIFLSGAKKTNAEFIDYIRCMTITQNVNPILYYCLKRKDLDKVLEYIDNPMTATTVSNLYGNSNAGSRQKLSSEVIYYQMIVFGIPFECEKWHLNRLLMLIKVCEVKNSNGSKKVNRSDIYSRNREVNEMRKAKFNTKG